MIDFMFAPTQMIRMGPRDTLGRELKMVRYGSITCAMKGVYQRNMAINIPNIVPKLKLINVSYIVIHI